MGNPSTSLSFTGLAAEKIDAIARRRFASGLQKHGLLGILLARSGYSGLPSKFMEAYQNTKMAFMVDTPLKESKVMDKTGSGQEFHYRILRDASDTFYSAPAAYNEKTTFDATSGEDRLRFGLKRIPETAAMMADEVQQIKGGIPGNLLGFEGRVGEAVIKILNGVARQFVLGDGTGNNLNGLADFCKAIMHWDGETDGTWTSKTIGTLDQDTYDSLKSYAYTTSVSTATTTLALAVAFKQKLSAMIRYGRNVDPSGSGLFMVAAGATCDRLDAVLAMANQQIIGQKADIGNKYIDILVGQHTYLEGVPVIPDSYVPANYIYCNNLNTFGMDWKIKGGPFCNTGVIDMAKVGSGYPIGTVGIQMEFQGNLVTCAPGGGSVISSFSG